MFTRERLTRWTDALRARPEKQFTGGGLANKDYSKLCCLGELCEVEGLERAERGYKSAGRPAGDLLGCNWQLTRDLGSNDGTFKELKMPVLVYKDYSYASAANANDNGVPWPVIAEHFDRFYPCSDTGPKEKA